MLASKVLIDGSTMRVAEYASKIPSSTFPGRESRGLMLYICWLNIGVFVFKVKVPPPPPQINGGFLVTPQKKVPSKTTPASAWSLALVGCGLHAVVETRVWAPASMSEPSRSQPTRSAEATDHIDQLAGVSGLLGAMRAMVRRPVLGVNVGMVHLGILNHADS